MLKFSITMKFIRLAFLLAGLIFVSRVEAEIKATVTDTTVVRLMNTFQYRAAANILNDRLKETSEKDYDKLLYYNNQLGIAYMRLQLFDSMMVCARKSLHFIVFSVDSSLISDGWKVASYAHNRNGNLDSAIFYTNLMLGYGERHGDKKLIRNSMTSLGTIMNQNNRFTEALEYSRKAYLLTEEIKDSMSYPTMLFNLGLTYNNLNRQDSCLYYLEKSLEHSLKVKNYDLAHYVYVMLSRTYLELNNFEKWKGNTLKLYKLAEQVNSKEYMAHAYNSLLYGLTKSKDYSEAISYGSKALDILKTSPFPSLQISVDSGMYVAHEAKGDYVTALKYLRVFYHEKYSMLSEKQRKHLNEMQVKFDIKEKDLTITRQKLELTDKQKSIQLLIFVLIIFILLVVGFGGYVVRNHRFRKELYRKEKYLDNQLSETRQWMEGIFMRESFISTVFPQLPYEGERESISPKELSPKSLLYAELREIIENQKLYLNPDLNLQEVIKLLGTNKKYLYEAISSSSDDNFRSFINRYRVDHAKKTIEESIHQMKGPNISELFSVSGFNNPTSFFRTFKAMTGLTPKEYAKEVEDDIKDSKL